LTTLELGAMLPPLPPGYTPGDNCVLIAGYRPVQESVIDRSLCARRFGYSNSL